MIDRLDARKAKAISELKVNVAKDWEKEVVGAALAGDFACSFTSHENNTELERDFKACGFKYEMRASQDKMVMYEISWK